MASNAKNLAELLNTDSTVAVGDIADGSVSTAKLADDAVTSAKLGASAVDATALASNAVTTAKVSDGAVTQAKTTGVGKGKNLIINGNFQVFQKGSGGATAGNNTYAKTDRFKYFLSGVTTTQDQQEFTPGQTDVPGEPRYYMRNILASNSGAGDYSIVAQHIEDVRTCAGQEVTLSFYAKSSVNGNKVAVEFSQSFGTGGSSRVTSAQTGDTGAVVTLTTSWAKYTVTTTIDSISGKTLGPSNTSFLELYLWMSAGSNYSRANGIGNQSGNFDFANIQLELGAQATDFEHRSFGEELQLCMRYYYKLGGDTAYQTVNTVVNFTGGTMLGHYQHPVQMRAAPTITKTGNWSTLGGDTTVGQNVSADQNGPKTVQLGFSGGSGGTSGRAATLRWANNINANLQFSAEL